MQVWNLAGAQKIMAILDAAMFQSPPRSSYLVGFVLPTILTMKNLHACCAKL
jgi:hypothetical protein